MEATILSKKYTLSTQVGYDAFDFSFCRRLLPNSFNRPYHLHFLDHMGDWKAPALLSTYQEEQKEIAENVFLSSLINSYMSTRSLPRICLEEWKSFHLSI